MQLKPASKRSKFKLQESLTLQHIDRDGELEISELVINKYGLRINTFPSEHTTFNTKIDGAKREETFTDIIETPITRRQP